jgi:hypothetical protein
MPCCGCTDSEFGINAARHALRPASAPTSQMRRPWGIRAMGRCMSMERATHTRTQEWTPARRAWTSWTVAETETGRAALRALAAATGMGTAVCTVDADGGGTCSVACSGTTTQQCPAGSGNCYALMDLSHCGNCVYAAPPSSQGQAQCTGTTPTCSVKCNAGTHACVTAAVPDGDCLSNSDLPSDTATPGRAPFERHAATDAGRELRIGANDEEARAVSNHGVRATVGGVLEDRTVLVEITLSGSERAPAGQPAVARARRREGARRPPSLRNTVPPALDPWETRSRVW